jgi:glycopeptide antibiotics resistance protein
MLLLARYPKQVAPTLTIAPLQTTFGFIDEIIQWYPVHPQLITGLLQLVVGNILLLLPWGCLAPLAFSRLRPSWPFFLSAVSLVLGFELAQYFLHLGYFDVDDVIYNLLGAILGHKLARRWLL